MKKTLSILLFTFFLLAIAAVVLHCLPHATAGNELKRVAYGINEHRQLVALVNDKGDTLFTVEDEEGNKLFNIPVRNSVLASTYQGGQLVFRNITTGRMGYIDINGNCFLAAETAIATHVNDENKTVMFNNNDANAQQTQAKSTTKTAVKSSVNIGKPTDLRQIAHGNPFFQEASKVLSGKLEETDASRRRVILNYCEHFRTAYTTKDVDFLQQVFSDKALIIVGNVVKTKTEDATAGIAGGERVTYAIRTKYEYLQRLTATFAANKAINMKFSDFKIRRHPTLDGIYGVTLRQQYKTDNYSDDGYLFLLWDFRNPSMPLIHVRTWQPSTVVKGSNDVIGIQDFNLE